MKPHFTLLALATLLVGACSDSTLSFEQSKNGSTEGPEESVILAKNVLAEQPKNLDARLTLANAQLELGNFFAAQKNFQTVLDSDTSSSVQEGYLIASTFLEEYTVVNDSVDLIKSPSDKLLSFLAIAALSVSDEKAISYIDSLVASKSTSYALLTKAYIAISNNQVKKAQELVDLALIKNSENPDAILFKAMLSERNMEFQVAADFYSSYREMRKQDNRVLVPLTRVSLLVGNFENADKYSKLIFSLSEFNSTANYAQAVLNYRAGNYKDVISYTQKAIENPELEKSSRLIAAAASYHEKNYEYAIRQLSVASKDLPPNDPINSFLLAIAIQLNDNELLSDILGEENLPTREEAVALLSAATAKMASSGDEALANKLQRNIIQYPESEQFLYFTQGLIDNLNNSLESAEKNFEEAFKADPENQNIAVLYVRSLLKDKKFDVLRSVLDEYEIGSQAFEQTLRILIAMNSTGGEDAFQSVLATLDQDLASPLTITLATNIISSTKQLDVIIDKLKNKQPLMAMLANQLVIQEKQRLGLDKVIAKSSFPIQYKIGLANTMAGKKAYNELINYVQTNNLVDNLSPSLEAHYLAAFVAQGRVDDFVNIAEARANKSDVAFTLLERFFEGSNNIAKLNSLLKTQDINDLKPQRLEKLIKTEITLGNLASAEQLITELDKKSQRDTQAALQAHIALKKGELDKARDLYTQAYYQDPNTRNAINTINALLENGDSKRAISLAREHIKLKDDSVVKLFLATLITTTSPDEALKLFESMDISKIYGNGVALNNYAYLLAENKQYEKAKLLARRALELLPDNDAVKDTMRKIEEKQ